MVNCDLMENREPERLSNLNSSSVAFKSERLSFLLPDFCRLTWVSDSARSIWAPRVRRIAEAWDKIEWLSVAEGLRKCCYVFATPKDFMDRGVLWAEHGLNAMPVQMQGVPRSGYASTSVPLKDGGPFQFRFVVGSPENVVKFRSATLGSNDQEMGELLGYPECCREFFKEIWVDQGLVDSTWQMALNTRSAVSGDRLIDISSTPPQSNILWRWMGVRAVSHLPCCFDCPSTIVLADGLIELGRRSGFGIEMGWLLEILQWPAEWSSLHGIAEIKTPLLKVSTRTDALASKHVVRFHGYSLPRESASGLNFPYSIESQSTRMTDAASFKKGLENSIVELSPSPNWLAHDNGFKSELAMNKAHQQIVEVAREILPNVKTILDLGCGNGALLKRLLGHAPTASPFGIDTNATAILHSTELHSGFSGNFVVGDLLEDESLWEVGRRYTLVLLMPGRLIESDCDRSNRLLQLLSARCDYLLAYAYGDWIERYGSVEKVAEAAGLTVVGSRVNCTACMVKVKG